MYASTGTVKGVLAVSIPARSLCVKCTANNVPAGHVTVGRGLSRRFYSQVCDCRSRAITIHIGEAGVCNNNNNGTYIFYTI